MVEPVLQIDGLYKSYGAMRATEDVSLTLLPGEIHALIGPNGAGKTTLIGQIAGGIAPDAGRIRLAGEDITDRSTAARARRGLGRSFQISSLAPELSPLAHIRLALQGGEGVSWRFWSRADRDTAKHHRAMAILEDVGLADRASLPVAALSHGERRLVELASALALDPVALLLDEPMAGLGMEGSQRMTAFLATLKTRVPILLIEHDMDAVFQLADRISVLVYGRIIASGPVDAIRADPEVQRAYLGETV